MRLSRRVLDQIKRASAQRAANARETVRWANGVVSNVAAGASRDGIAQVTVNVNGDSVLAPYLQSNWTPTVGDLVSVRFRNGSPLIEGHVVGLPTF